jgi:hypothetical protein
MACSRRHGEMAAKAMAEKAEMAAHQRRGVAAAGVSEMK